MIINTLALLFLMPFIFNSCLLETGRMIYEQ